MALKLVHPHLRESEDAASTLIEEAKLAARIRHPNVVAVREVGEAEAGIFLVMDYVEGATLSKLVRVARERQLALPLPIAARILKDALLGLHAAHELANEDGSPLHLVHRDFSPQNVLVGLDGVTRLTDFGIAKAASRAGVTSTGVVKGKLGYLSPEQALGKPLDRRSDIWAAGVVAWELCTGRRLVDAEAEAMSAILKIVSEPPPRLSSVRPELSPLLDQAIATALNLDPIRRWPSADEMWRALAEGFKPHGGVAESEEVGAWVEQLVGDELAARRSSHRRSRPHPPPPRRRSRSATFAIGTAALASLALAAWALGAGERERPKAQPPPPQPVAIAPIASAVSPEPEPEPEPERERAPEPERHSTQPKLERKPPTPVRRAPKPAAKLGPNPYRTP